jgi:hypothetical protein
MDLTCYPLSFQPAESLLNLIYHTLLGFNNGTFAVVSRLPGRRRFNNGISAVVPGATAVL